MTAGGSANRFKTGLLLKIKDAHNVIGVGEASSLPGVVSHEEAMRFGKDMAQLVCHMKREGPDLSGFLGQKNQEQLQIQALLSGTRSECLSQIRVFLKLGYKNFKVKVGRHSIQHDLNNMLSLRAEAGPHAGFVCDANQAFVLHEAIALGKGLRRLGVRYIEEPLKDPRQLCEFSARSELPYALDESLPSANLIKYSRARGLAALVLKPSALGLEQTMFYAKYAREHGLGINISASYESPLGLGFLALLAFYLQTPGLSVGLSTHHFFEKGADTWGFFENPARLKYKTHIEKFMAAVR